MDQFLTVYQNSHADSLPPNPSHNKYQVRPDHPNHPNSSYMMKKEELPDKMDVKDYMFCQAFQCTSINVGDNGGMNEH